MTRPNASHIACWSSVATLAIFCTPLFVRAADNQPPEGFVALFNGRDLTGWKGLLARPNDNPLERAKLSADDLAAAQQKADESMRAHWSAVDGVLTFDGKGQSICTAKDYADCELLIDWKIERDGDSGIYLRGVPQVQIWDPDSKDAKGTGSGGLYNNQKNPSKPLVRADRPVGEWNSFRIKLVGDRVSVWLNDTLVADNVMMENLWDPKQPLFPVGQIELQSHGTRLHFKNIHIRELKNGNN